MPSANRNTTQLSMGIRDTGTIGQRDFNDYQAKEISANVSRRVYQRQVVTDKQLDEFRQVVYKMVSGYAREDKIAIITEYGDASLLKGDISESKLNKICTETLIIHLDPATLRQLRDDLGARESELRKQVKNLEKKRSHAFKGFNTDTFEDLYREIKDTKKDNFINKNINKIDDKYKVPKDIQALYPQLRKELYDVLRNCYNKIEVVVLAHRMGLEVDPSTTEKILYKWIANKTILYVALITGKSKKFNLGNSIFDTEPFDELLQYTSFAYVTGKPGMDQKSWAQRQLEAKRAKRAIEERSRLQNSRKNMYGSAEINQISHTSSISRRQLKRKLKKNDTGILADASRDEIIQLAAEYGVNPTGRLYKVKTELYNKIAAQMRYTQKLKNKLAKGKVSPTINDKYQINTQNPILKNLMETGKSANLTLTSDSLTTESGVPLVQFARSGVIKTKSILQAVPVYIIGQGKTGDSRTDDEINKEKNTVSTNKDIVSNRKNKRYNRDILDEIDVNMTKEDLSPDDYKIFTYFTTSEISKLREIASSLVNNGGVPSHIVSQAENDSITTVDKKTKLDPFQFGLRLCWLFAKAGNRNKLAAFITKEYGIIYNYKIKKYKVKTALSKTKNTGKQVAAGTSILASGLLALANPIAGAIGAAAGIGSLLISKFKRKRLANKQRMERESEITNIGKEIGKTNIPYGPSTDGTTLGIPKVSFNSGMNSVDTSSIFEVVPVYVVNNQAENDFKKGNNRDDYTDGIGKNVDLITEYNKKYNLQPQNGKNRVLFTKSPSDNATNMIKLGYTPISSIFNKIINPANDIPGKTHVLKNEDIEWALKNNYQFATGGILSNINSNNSIITGDSLNGKENREVVTWHPNGLSVRPEKSGPQNGYSSLAMDQFATGGDKITSEQSKNKIYRLSQLTGKLLKKEMYLSDSARKLDIDSILSVPAIPVYTANDSNYDVIKNAIENANSATLEKLDDLILGLGTGFTLAAPFGVGQGFFGGLVASGIKNKIMNVANKALLAAAPITIAKALGTASTGGIIKSVNRYATGGTNSIITGDASGNDIFKGGAKPEIVQSASDMKVIPLNKTGTESKQKVDRMTTSERRSALATAISSHIIKYNYSLKNADEVSNTGEAIKVYNVKPGITDEIIVNGATTTMADMIAAIYNQLINIGTISTTNAQSLVSIAANTSKIGANSSNNNNIFANSFTSSLDDILGGN